MLCNFITCTASSASNPGSICRVNAITADSFTYNNEDIMVLYAASGTLQPQTFSNNYIL